MGLLDGFKQAKGMQQQGIEMQKQAQKMMANSPAMAMPTAEEQARVNWHNKMLAEGLDGEATIKTIRETGKAESASGAKEFELELDADLGGDPYPARAELFIADANVDTYTPGSRWTIKADPSDKSHVLVLFIKQ